MGKREKRKRRQKRENRYETRWDAWAEKTDARLFTPEDFLAYKEEQGLFVLGVMGYAGSWRHAGYKGEALKEWIGCMRRLLAEEILSYSEERGEALVVASGATSLGVLQVTYALCAQEGVRAMGITSDGALRYKLGEQEYVVPVGRSFGDESEAFVRLCDAFLLLGGGEQSKAETLAAHEEGKPVTVIQGFGGAADGFCETSLPRASFVQAGALPAKNAQA